MSRRILRLSEVSERTGVPLGTLRFYRHKGIGPHTWLLGGKVVAFENDVDDWIEEQARKARGGSPAVSA